MITKIKIDNIKNIVINSLCLETHYCQHGITIITKDNKKYNVSYMIAFEIMFYSLKINKNINKHFNNYIEEFKRHIKNKTIYNYLMYYDIIDDSIYLNIINSHYNIKKVSS